MPGSPLKIWAMPTASDTAPPVRPVTTSPTACSSPGRFTIGMPSVAKTCGDTLMAK